MTDRTTDEPLDRRRMILRETSAAAVQADEADLRAATASVEWERVGILRTLRRYVRESGD
jgi:hypothetical protein